MRDNVTATEYRGRQMRIQTCVKVKGGYFDHKLWHFSDTVTFLLIYNKQLIVMKLLSVVE